MKAVKLLRNMAMHEGSLARWGLGLTPYLTYLLILVVWLDIAERRERGEGGERQKERDSSESMCVCAHGIKQQQTLLCLVSTVLV